MKLMIAWLVFCAALYVAIIVTIGYMAAASDRATIQQPCHCRTACTTQTGVS